MWNPVLSQSLPKITGLSLGTSTSSSAPIGGLPTSAAQQPSGNTYGTTSNNQTSTGYYSNIQWNTAQVSPSTTGNPRPPAPQSQTVEDIVAQHEQDLLDKIVEETEAETRAKIDESLETQINYMWEQDRKVWLEELIGYRNLGPVTTLAIGNGPSVPVLTNGGTTPVAALPSSSNATNNRSMGWSQSQSLVLGRGNREGYLELNFVEAHWSIIKNHKSMSNPIEIAEQLKNLVTTEMKKSERPSPILAGYSTALDWVMTLLELDVKSSPLNQATATLVHLARQFDGVIKLRVQMALGSGQISDSVVFDEEGARNCFLYAQLVLGGHSVWSVLFYCLRIGDAKAAQEVWTKTGDSRLTDMQQAAISSILSSMNRGGSKCFWEKGIPSLPFSECKALADLMDRQDTSSDIHYRGVLALLSGMNDMPMSDATPGFTNIEDYLYGRLWKAMLADEPLEQLGNFGNDILNFGASYFQDEESAGWSYALPLLVSQQYARAFVHLAESGKDVLLQTTHLTLLLASGGVQISNFGEAAGDRHYVAKFVEAYANCLLQMGAGPLGALDYIIRIPQTEVARKEIAKLISNTGQIATLVGPIDDEGLRREDGPLDPYFGPEDIRKILEDAAGLSLRNRHDSVKVMGACFCYLTGGSYSHAINLLIDMISPPEIHDENRAHWVEQSSEFIKAYLKKRTHLSNQLERDGKLHLGKTLDMLVKLNRFFEAFDTGHFKEAWSIIAETNLLPLTEADRNRLEPLYRGSMHVKIRSCYPELLLRAMKILKYEHALMKKEVRGSAAQIATETLTRLQAQARSIVIFAGLIDAVPVVQKESLSHMEALMI